MKVTMSMVAKKAGVSKMTVSRVVRGEDTVRDETKKHVNSVMEELGYIPSPIAQSLRSNDRLKSTGAQLIATIFGSGTDAAIDFFHAVSNGIEQTSAKFGLCPIQVNWQDNIKKSWSRLQTVFSIQGLCGALLIGQFTDEEIKQIQKQIKYLVIVDGPAPDMPGIGSVESGNLEGSLIALNHLIDLNCKRILIITVQKDHYFTTAVEMAANQKKSNNVHIDIVYNCFSAYEAYSVIDKIFSKGIEYDGIFTNDEFCIGVIKALNKSKVAIPEEIKIIGFDDTHYAPLISPTLTSIRIDKFKLGTEAVHSLVSIVRSSGKSYDIRKVIRPSLIIRETTEI